MTPPCCFNFSSSYANRKSPAPEVELQREAIGVLTLSKFLVEETLSAFVVMSFRGRLRGNEGVKQKVSGASGAVI